MWVHFICAQTRLSFERLEFTQDSRWIRNSKTWFTPNGQPLPNPPLQSPFPIWHSPRALANWRTLEMHQLGSIFANQFQGSSKRQIDCLLNGFNLNWLHHLKPDWEDDVVKTFKHIFQNYKQKNCQKLLSSCCDCSFVENNSHTATQTDNWDHLVFSARQQQQEKQQQEQQQLAFHAVSTKILAGQSRAMLGTLARQSHGPVWGPGTFQTGPLGQSPGNGRNIDVKGWEIDKSILKSRTNWKTT